MSTSGAWPDDPASEAGSQAEADSSAPRLPSLQARTRSGMCPGWISLPMSDYFSILYKKENSMSDKSTGLVFSVTTDDVTDVQSTQAAEEYNIEYFRQRYADYSNPEIQSLVKEDLKQGKIQYFSDFWKSSSSTEPQRINIVTHILEIEKDEKGTAKIAYDTLCNEADKYHNECNNLLDYCMVCWDEFDTEKSKVRFGCGHNVCLKCLKSMFKEHKKSTTTTTKTKKTPDCPQCGEKYNIDIKSLQFSEGVSEDLKSEVLKELESEQIDNQGEEPINVRETIQPLIDGRYNLRDDSELLSKILTSVYHKDPILVFNTHFTQDLHSNIKKSYRDAERHFNPTLKKIVNHACWASTDLHYHTSHSRRPLQRAKDDVRSILFYSMIYLVEIVSASKKVSELKPQYYGIDLRRSPFFAKSLLRVLFFANSITNSVDISCTLNPRWIFTDQFDTFEKLFTHEFGSDLDSESVKQVLIGASISSSTVFSEPQYDNINTKTNDPLESALAIYCLAKQWNKNFDSSIQYYPDGYRNYHGYLSSIWTYAMATLPSNHFVPNSHLKSNTRDRLLASLLMSFKNDIPQVVLNSFAISRGPESRLNVSETYGLRSFVYNTEVFLNSCLRGYTVYNFHSLLLEQAFDNNSTTTVLTKLTELLKSAEYTRDITLRLQETRIGIGYEQIIIGLETIRENLQVGVGGSLVADTSGSVVAAVVGVAIIVLSSAIPR